MKDKLVKTGHRKFYYRLQTTLVAFAFSLVVVLFAAIPVAITYRLASADAKADTSETSEKSEALDSSSSSEMLETETFDPAA
jgi:hypothetical protein